MRCAIIYAATIRFPGGSGEEGKQFNSVELAVPQGEASKCSRVVRYLTDDFIWATEQLMAVANMCCQGRIVSVLEGGSVLRPNAQPFFLVDDRFERGIRKHQPRRGGSRLIEDVKKRK